MRLKKGDMVLVEWDDIVNRSSWTALKKVAEMQPAKCKDVGFFLEDDGKVIRILHSISDDDHGGPAIIPKGCVTRIKKLREV